MSSNFNIQQYTDALIEKDGIFFSKDKCEISYPKNGNENCFKVEENSFWFKHRNSCILEMVKKYAPDKLFFDIGGGNGFVSKCLEDNGIQSCLIEPGEQGCINAKTRGLSNIICSTIDAGEFKTGVFPTVGLFDVIEHIEDDENFLKSINSYLQADGIVFITVPALKMLWSNEDIDAGHFRRYTKKQLISLMEKNNFKILYATYFFSFLLLPILFFRAWKDKLYSKKENIEKVHSSSSKIISFGLKIIEKTELKFLIKNKRIISGSSIICIAKKNK